MKNIFLLLFCIIFYSCKQQHVQKSSVSKNIKSIYIDVDSISQMNHLKVLSSDAFMGRATGTKGGEISKNYIAKEYEKLELDKLGDSYFQSFTFSGKGHHGTTNSNIAYNVLGFIKGTITPEKVIVVGAHYDHLGSSSKKVYNGADDNASGTAALFSIIKYFKENPPQKSIVIAAWDAEEIGLQGSKYYVNHSIIPINNIVCNVNMDMIGRNTNSELYISGSRFNDILKKEVVSNLYSKKISILTGHDGADGQDDWTYSSDHGPFFDKGIPFLYFGVEDHSDYHKSTDDYSKIQPDFYIESTRVVIQAINKIDVKM